MTNGKRKETLVAGRNSSKPWSESEDAKGYFGYWAFSKNQASCLA